MIEPLRPVFLSYASQDTDAARRICEALRAIGVEVWFDQSEVWGRINTVQIPQMPLCRPYVFYKCLRGGFQWHWLKPNNSHE